MKNVLEILQENIKKEEEERRKRRERAEQFKRRAIDEVVKLFRNEGYDLEGVNLVAREPWEGRDTVRVTVEFYPTGYRPHDTYHHYYPAMTVEFQGEEVARACLDELGESVEELVHELTNPMRWVKIPPPPPPPPAPEEQQVDELEKIKEALRVLLDSVKEW